MAVVCAYSGRRIVVVVFGIWLLLHVAVRILIMKTERDLLRIKLAAFGLDVTTGPRKPENATYETGAE